MGSPRACHIDSLVAATSSVSPGAPDASSDNSSIADGRDNDGIRAHSSSQPASLSFSLLLFHLFTVFFHLSKMSPYRNQVNGSAMVAMIYRGHSITRSPAAIVSKAIPIYGIESESMALCSVKASSMSRLSAVAIPVQHSMLHSDTVCHCHPCPANHRFPAIHSWSFPVPHSWSSTIQWIWAPVGLDAPLVRIFSRKFSESFPCVVGT